MDNALNHIALHVNESDVISFYLEVLHGEVRRTFELSKEVSSEIFSINKNVKVVLVYCQGIDFELFVDDNLPEPTFAHVCFQSDQARKILERANLSAYCTYLHKNNSTETYFIRDTNNNLFEIKNNEAAPEIKNQLSGAD